MADLLTTAETADLFGKSVPTINRWAASGRIPVAQKLGGRRGAYLFDRVVIQDLAREARLTRMSA